MPEKYSKEKFWQLYQKLPPDLKEAVFSEETAEAVYDICKKNGIDEPSLLASYVQEVLLGILAPEDFQKTLESEAGFKKDVTKEIVKEINRFVFYPVRPALEKLHGVGSAGSVEKETETRANEKESAQRETKPLEVSPSKDTYREDLE